MGVFGTCVYFAIRRVTAAVVEETAFGSLTGSIPLLLVSDAIVPFRECSREESTGVLNNVVKQASLVTFGSLGQE
jgi:hypothetical protein